MNDPFFPDILVNGETIPSHAVAAEIQNHIVPQGKQAIAWRKAARALAIRALLLQEARQRGLAPNSREIAPGKTEAEPEALIRALLDEALVPEEPDEHSLHAFYQAHPERFRAPSLYEASHILFAAPAEDQNARAKARARAEAVLAELKKDEKRFEHIARLESDCSSREAGGRLGQIGRGETVPEFDRMLDTLAPGRIARDPVETRFGFHILRLDARADGEILPFETVKPRLLEATEKAAWTRAANAFITGLVSKATISGIDMRPE